MKILFHPMLIILLPILSSVYAQTGWFEVTRPLVGFNLKGIYFADANTGLVDKWKTTNGGLNWVQTIGNPGNAIYFINTTTGYRVGNTFFSRSTNLGSSWQSYIVTTGSYQAVYFIDINTGYLSGLADIIIKTTTGGIGGLAGWTTLNPGISGYDYQEIYFLNSNTGFINGIKSNDESVIIKTNNGGSNWSNQVFAPDATTYTLAFINENTGIAAGKKIFKTTNGGANWVEKTSPISNMRYYCIAFRNASVAFMAGAGGGIVKTIDGGETWFQQSTGLTTPSFNDMYFINDTTGYVCGENGYVLKTTDGGGPPIGIIQISNEVPDKFSLSQNYPNPFNPAAKIKFEIPNSESGIVTLKVYDILGREISTLVNESLKPGIYEADFDGTQFASGVYYYTLKTDDFSQTKRMVLIK